jgi:hypothetical protein
MTTRTLFRITRLNLTEVYCVSPLLGYDTELSCPRGLFGEAASQLESGMRFMGTLQRSGSTATLVEVEPPDLNDRLLCMSSQN